MAGLMTIVIGEGFDEMHAIAAFPQTCFAS